MVQSDKKVPFEKFFAPKSMAVIGVSAEETAFGTLFLRSLVKFGFKGKLYPVNPRGGSVFGLIIYPSVAEIPDTVDLAVVSVPARLVAGVLEECLKKDIHAAIVLSGGFSEFSAEGKKFEDEVAKVAAKGIRIVGPNCHGIYCPSGGLTVLPGSSFPRESGPVALVTQSGQFAEMIVLASRGLGIRYSKVLSFGNARDLNESDYFEYLTEDPETKIITAYLEGVKQGRRFLEVVKKAARVKPVLIWKVGLTNTGRKAASSHTGSLTGDEVIWDTFFRQSGAIRIENMEDLIDTTIAFLHLPPRAARKVGLMIGSGGGTVIGSDAAERAGLQIPTLPIEVQKTLSAFLPRTNVRNPVDMADPHPPAKVLGATLEAVASNEEIEAMILGRMFLSVKGPGIVLGFDKNFEKGREELKSIPVRIKEKYGKPFIMVLSEEVSDVELIDFEADRRDLRNYYLSQGIPVYPTVERAIKSLANFARYQERFHPETSRSK
jgi:acyl-CoA synthetase (NDP forming)